MNLLEIIGGTVANLFILLGFVTLLAIARGISVHLRRPVPTWQTGLLFGCMALIAMLVPAAGGNDMIFDCRSGVIGSGALLGGPVVALISVPIPFVFRFYLGGGGMLPGLMEIVFPAIIGAICHLWFKRRHEDLTLMKALVSGLAIGAISNGFIFLFVSGFGPNDNMAGAATIVVLLSAPISTALLSTLILLEGQHTTAVDTITEAESQMLHSQKMAAVGQLARLVAHRFANCMTAVLGNAQLAKDFAHDPSRVRQNMDDLITTVGRASHLTGELLAFSSPASIRLRPMDFSKCLTGIDIILRDTIGHDIELVIEAEKTGKVNIDPDRMEQAVMHIAVNAAESIEQNGKVTISVAPARLSERESASIQGGTHEKNRHKGEFAFLSVTDTGCGMTDDVVSRVFEPFFTTKENRENAGLGLSSTYNIIQQHNGHIVVKSRPGHGSTFLIYLPVVDPPSAS